MTEAQKAKVEKQKEKEATAKQKLKDQKVEAKLAKTEAADRKKVVASSLKMFVSNPTKDNAKDYKNDVAAHIKSVNVAVRLAAKLPKKAA